MRDLETIKEYWNTQAEAFTEISMDELTSDKFELWYSILAPILANDNALSILDVGCGAGFFEMFIGRWGHHVTAVDYNEKMLQEARKNVTALGIDMQETIFRKMDAQNLEFEDSRFDLVISRNITWVLEDPVQAYKEWLRVLKPGGILLNFDANWFLHLHDEAAKQAYENGRKAAAERGFTIRESDHNPEFEQIVRRLPLSMKRRPQWDFDTLLAIGCEKITVYPRLSNRIYDDYYAEIYKEIPTFMIHTMKSSF